MNLNTAATQYMSVLHSYGKSVLFNTTAPYNEDTLLTSLLYKLGTTSNISKGLLQSYIRVSNEFRGVPIYSLATRRLDTRDSATATTYKNVKSSIQSESPNGLHRSKLLHR